MTFFYIAMIILIVPLPIGIVAGLILPKVRSDILALLSSLIAMLMFRVFVSTDHPNIQQFYTATFDENILALSTLSSICTALIFPYIFCRWGVDIADLIKRKMNQRKSSGNLVVISLFVIGVISISVQMNLQFKADYPELIEEQPK